MCSTITSADQYAFIAHESKGLIVIKCGAKWCKPCVNSHDEYCMMAIKYPSVQFYTLDIDDVSDFEDAPEVVSLPTILLINDRKPIGCVRGADFENLITLVEQWK